MNDQSSAADVLLKLYELRTETTLRQARNWFTYEFHPQSAKEVLRVWLGPGHESAPYRMVTSYWDMAATLVRHGAVPTAMFNAANTEHVAVYAKLRPFLAEIRETTSYPDYLTNLEQLVTGEPDAEMRIGIFSRYIDRQRALAAAGRQQSYLTQTPPSSAT